MLQQTLISSKKQPRRLTGPILRNAGAPIVYFKPPVYWHVFSAKSHDMPQRQLVSPAKENGRKTARKDGAWVTLHFAL